MRCVASLLVVFFCALAQSALAVEPENQAQQASTERYRVLDARNPFGRRNYIQQQLNEAASEGYRLAYGDVSHALVLEKTSSKYEYRVLEHSNDALKRAAADGFRVTPLTLSSDSRVWILEKELVSSERHDYILLDKLRRQTLQNALNEAGSTGYELVAMSPEAVTVIMEKHTSVGVSSPKYLAPSESPRAMENKLKQGIATGYAVTLAIGGQELTLVMERVANFPDYLLIGQHDTESLQREIEKAGVDCFRPVPRTLVFVKRHDGDLPIPLLPVIVPIWDGPVLSMFAPRSSQANEGLIIILEKTPRCEAFEYKILGTHLLGTFKKQLSQAAADGFEIIATTFSTKQIALLRRPSQRSAQYY